MSAPERDPTRARVGDRLIQATPGRRALSWIYRAGRATHRGLYERGWVARGRLNAPVICVGNLTLGGTGKTPFLIELTRQLRARGHRPAVLSRGYGSRPPARYPRIVSDGAGFLAEVERAGDEPLLIARRCPGTPVIIGARRFSSGLLAEKEFDPDCYLLDDGFQHEALARDANLVLWDARDLPSELHVLPAGRLREPVSALERATALILTHAEYLEGEEGAARLQAVEGELGAIRGSLPRFRMVSGLGDVKTLGHLEGPGFPLGDLAGKRVFLLTGLARPEGFESMIRGAGLEVAGHMRLPDHATYSKERVGEILSAAEKAGAGRVLTTAKDAVKLERHTEDPRFGVVDLDIRIEEEKAWSEFLDGIVPPGKPKEAEAGDD